MSCRIFDLLFNPINHRRIAFLVLSTLLTLTVSLAEASWWIDMERFSKSAHAETACTDCHSDVAGRNLHPDPGHVNLKLNVFFDREQCVDCHEEVYEQLDEGRHAEETLPKPETYFDCIRCHDPHYLTIGTDHGKTHPDPGVDLPMSDEDRPCFDCHGAVAPDDPQKAQKIATFCFQCHGFDNNTQTLSIGYPRIDVVQYPLSAHAKVECSACHPQAAMFEHGKQKGGDCRQCHPPHDEKTAHDAHIGVTCRACHLENIAPIRKTESGIITGEIGLKQGPLSRTHHMPRLEDKSACRKCHFKGNVLGAAAMVLPPKSLLCMPCHSATLTVSDTVSLSGLVIFLIGLMLTFSIWQLGSIPDKGALRQRIVRTVFSWNFFGLLKTLSYDMLFQRRLYHRSHRRWMIHGLIFYPFVVRFLWGLVALGGSLGWPAWAPIWNVVDKNHPLTALVFDITGIFIGLGVILALVRGAASESDRSEGIPRQDRLALGIIGAMVMVGFFLEGIRIAMTGYPPNSIFAPVGYGISLLFSGMTGLSDIYGYIWYGHAILAGIFIAYLPFSRLMHIIMAPLVMVLNAFSETEPGRA